MGYHTEDFFLDLNVKECNSLDDFLDRIRHLVKNSERSTSQARLMAIAILASTTDLGEQGLLHIASEAIGAWSDSEVFILEKRNKECEIVQAGILPEGCKISFKNNFN